MTRSDLKRTLNHGRYLLVRSADHAQDWHRGCYAQETRHYAAPQPRALMGFIAFCERDLPFYPTRGAYLGMRLSPVDHCANARACRKVQAPGSETWVQCSLLPCNDYMTGFSDGHPCQATPFFRVSMYVRPLIPLAGQFICIKSSPRRTNRCPQPRFRPRMRWEGDAGR